MADPQSTDDRAGACNCWTLRETARTESAPKATDFECYYIEWFARKLVVDPSDPWGNGGLYLCACRACGARWQVQEVTYSSDNSPSPDTTYYSWREHAWTDAQLGEALREMPRLEAEQQQRAKAWHADWMEEQRRLQAEDRAERDLKRERERPRRVKEDTWLWGPEGRQDTLRVWPEFVDHGMVLGHPQEGGRWSHEEFLAAYPDFLPREVYDQAADLVRAMRDERQRKRRRPTVD